MFAKFPHNQNIHSIPCSYETTLQGLRQLLLASFKDLADKPHCMNSSMATFIQVLSRTENLEMDFINELSERCIGRTDSIAH